jgi:hypothetical protein
MGKPPPMATTLDNITPACRDCNTAATVANGDFVARNSLNLSVRMATIAYGMGAIVLWRVRGSNRPMVNVLRGVPALNRDF